ncbi:hypothetical protein RIF29_15807 [Crotalaria pallida]|uniref:TOPLESS zinc finger domain-containing protein n=1 Tax=Crotalaria pallida TaxID=3830 RepID=A0AAN9FJS1_CROPI
MENSLRNHIVIAIVAASTAFSRIVHQLCKNPRPNPDIKTLFVDHSCGQPNGARAPSPAGNPLLGSYQRLEDFLLLVHMGWATELIILLRSPFQPTPAQVPTPLAGWMSNPSTVAHAAVSGGGAIGLGAPSIPSNTFVCFLLSSLALYVQSY